MKNIDARRRYFASNQLKIRIREQGRYNRFLAKQIGVSDSHFSRVLTGERWVSEEHARIVASILGVDFFSLWKLSDDSKPQPGELAA